MHVVDTTHSPFAKLRSVPSDAVTLHDTFWEPRREINRTVTLTTQFKHIEETGRLDNFRRASGKKPGLPFQGIFFNDSDVYKWLEAAASEWANASPELKEMIEVAIQEIEDAQQPDGYLNTYFMFEKEKDRWTNLQDMHELYCAGHLFQAAVAHYRATGSPRLLNVARRFADNICQVFGPKGRAGACGHEEAELALVELYRVTGEKRYLEQAQRFIDVRGSEPSVVGGHDRRYRQDHVPYRQLDEVTGHAVRMMYLAAGAADVYLETGETALWEAMQAQWANMTERRMYVSGGLGARYEGEAFGKDYELPNARAYTETCAAIGSVMWNYRLLLASGDCRYADLIEHTLYNAVLPGLSLSGEEYFYQNPLENDGTHRRQPWFGCACCPPNVARLLAQLPGYFYSVSDGGEVYVHLYANGEAQLTLPNGDSIRLETVTKYPIGGEVAVVVQEAGTFTLNLRIPEWARGAMVTVKQGTLPTPEPGTYMAIHREWEAGDTLTLSFPMEPRTVWCHPAVSENNGRVALFRGPLLYCAEKADNPDVDNLHDLVLAGSEGFTWAIVDNLHGVILAMNGHAVKSPPAHAGLYSEKAYAGERNPVGVTLIPYYAWANREPGQMLVWLRFQDGT